MPDRVQPGEAHRFLVGMNLPWVRYGCDFGANAWQPGGGLGAGTDLPRTAALLTKLRANGVMAVRWFLFCDGRAGVRFDAAGAPQGLDPFVERDVEIALDLVRAAGLHVVLVLLDFGWARRRRRARGVSLGGHAGALRRPDWRAALMAQVLAPILRRFGDHEAVLAWDLMNEPEWVTRGFGTWRPWGLSAATVRAYLAEAASLVHTCTRQLVTAGSASARWLGLVRGVGLDVYQPHWYDHLDSWAPLESPVAGWGLDRPAWLGEAPTRGSRHDPVRLLELAHAAGYSGAWLWSALADDIASDGVAAAAATREWWTRAGGTPGGLGRSGSPPRIDTTREGEHS
jgi:hypothetical protein